MRDSNSKGSGMLAGIRVLELTDERGEFCGKLLAGAGADVIKVEPPLGSSTRRIGPFYEDIQDPEKSLHFWHYNFGKRGVTLDLNHPRGQKQFRELVTHVDVLLESHPPGHLPNLGIDYESLKGINPRLVMASITPFGQSGPYRDWKGSDLVHLAMGGMTMLTGYDPTPGGEYDISPIAPQMWHAYHMVGSQAYIAILAAILYREQSGAGQYIDAAVHRSVNRTTGSDVPLWIYQRREIFRQTSRNAESRTSPEVLSTTKDGRHLLTYMFLQQHQLAAIKMLAERDAADDLTDGIYQQPGHLEKPEAGRHLAAVVGRWVSQYQYNRDLWRIGQEHGLHYAPIRKPEENLTDPHWLARQTFLEVDHEDLGKRFMYVGAPWLSELTPWRTGPRAPRLGEHTEEVFSELRTQSRPVSTPLRSAHQSPPFAIENVRVLDLGWVVAGAGGGSYLASLGAEDIRVEWKGQPDNIRRGGTTIPVGEERDRVLRGESVLPTWVGQNQSGSFADVNLGKRGIGLNLRHEKGRELLKELVRVSDIIVENFTANTMDKLGLGYEELRQVNPSIIYIQQPGFGKKGLYADFKSSAPVAEAFTGITEMSGLPSPYKPAGWGTFYLDYSATYCCAMAMLSALYHRTKTGRGQYIDSSLAEYGICMTGTAILDYSANGRSWDRIGNRSPYKPAAPHGIYRCKGKERWIAIACFTDDEWRAMAQVLGSPAWTRDPKFATLGWRMQQQEELEVLVQEATKDWDAFELMTRMQEAGVPAGVCQTAADRVDRDPQLDHDKVLVPATNSEIGEWPVKTFPVNLSETPSHPSGTHGTRSFPSYAEDNDYVYGTILGLSKSEITRLAEEEII